MQTQSDVFGKMNYNGFTQGNFVYRDEKGELKPYFWKSFKISEDGKQIDFTYPTTAKWHDGEPVTDDDIVFTFDYMKNVKKVGSLENLESCKITGEGEATLTFSKPDAYLWLNSSVSNTACVYPKHIWEGVEDYEEFNKPEAAIGCGPYKLVSHDAESQTSVYEAVPENNFLGDILVDKVTVRSFQNPESLMMAMDRGEIDAMYAYSKPIDATVMDSFIGKEGLDIGESDYSGHYQLTYGMERKPGSDIEFRKAVRSALDYDKLASVINGKYGKAPGSGIISPTCRGFDESLPTLSRDLDKANSILDKAGYVDADGDGFRDMPDGSKLDVMVTPQFSKDQEILQRIADTIMAALKDVNIKSHIDQDSLRNGEVWEANIQDGKYDLSIGYTTSGMAEYTSAFRYFIADPRFEGEQTWIWGTYHNDDFTNTYYTMEAATNDDEYIKGIKKLQKMADEDVFAQALCWQKAFFPYRTDKYEGWTNIPSWGVVNCETWYNVHPISK